jgi:general stress protein 26
MKGGIHGMANAIERAGEIIRERTAGTRKKSGGEAGFAEGKTTEFETYNNQYCILAQEDTDGLLTASVITPAKSDGIKWITFCTGLGSNKSKRIERDSRAAVCFDSDSYSITLKGRLEILTDEESKQEHWYKGLENHFSGPDDPNYCVLRFHTEKYGLFVDWEESAGSL